MPKTKWSSFPNVGPATTGDETVGLRGGVNVSFDATEFEIINVDDVTIDGDTISTNTANGNLYLEPNGTGHVDVGDPGLEVGNILIDGIAFNSRFRVNDIGNTAPAMVTIHKHSTTQEPLQISARSNSDTSAHATVTANMPLYSMYATGWLNSYYGIFGQIRFSADSTGTLADGSAPGKLELMVTPNSSVIPVTALSINNAGVSTLAKDAVINTVNIGLGGGNIATNTRVGVSALGANTTGARNVAEGYQALTTCTTATDNVAVGYLALSTNQTGGAQVAVGSNALKTSTAGQNVAVGYNALTASTTGGTSVAIGYIALQSMTNAGNNVAIGHSAMQASTSGNNNTAVGSNALFSNVSGGNHVAIGEGALYTTTGNLYNTGIGVEALNKTTHDFATAVGFRALYLYTNAGGSNYPTALGSLAMDALTTGHGVAVGFSALGALTTGLQNAAVGTSALSALTTNGNCAAFGFQSLLSATGANNTAFGTLTGNSGATGAVTLTTGQSNTMIGYRACPNAADAAGTISIGADAVANKATGATNADDGPGIAVGSAAFPVGFRGDGTIYPTAGSISGYMQVKINGTNYKIALYALS